MLITPLHFSVHNVGGMVVMSVSSIIYCACVASSFLFAKYFIRCLAPFVASGAQVLAAASYHSTIRYFIRCLAPSVAFGAQVLPAAYH